MSNSEKKHSILDHSDLLQEWDWERNQQLGITPQKVTPGSTRKLFWKCKHGHIWQATPANRYRGQGCPVCAGRKVLAGFNDFASRHPEPAREWHTKKNSFMPWEVTSHSNKRVLWKCEKCSNEWITSVNNRAMGKGCPICGRAKQIEARANNRIEKYGSFAANYPDILIEWDYEKNNSNPELLTKNSTERAWWKCKKCGYSWVTTVMHRTTRRSGCPACANKKTTASNCLQATHPHVLLKWNYCRNLNITPNDVTAGSNRKVWWICDNGHEWEAAVTSIVNGGQCPICCGQRVLQGYNDLATVNPELSKEWHPIKNGNLLPIHVTAGSSRNKVWWICAYGHEYQARIADRNKGTGCPICDKERKTSFPEQAIYFYLQRITRAENRYLYDGKCEIDVYLPEFHIGIEYDGLYYHAGINVKAKEQKKEEYLRNEGIRLIRVKEVKALAAYEDRNDTIYCVNNGQYGYLKNVIWKILQRIPELTDKKNAIDIDVERDSMAIMSEYICSEKERSLATKNPTLAAEWHPTRNGYIKPEMVSCASGKKVWWLGNCGHEWVAAVINRAAGNGCPICANKVVLVGYNDLETTHPELAKEWDYTKNSSLSPRKVTYGSDKKVWWICAAGHSYTSTIANRYYGKGCPYCSNVKVLCGFNDLLSQYPDIAKEWIKERNDDTPDHILPGSNKKVWWRCKVCSHEWRISPNHRVYRSSGCPACSGRVATDNENLYMANRALCFEWDYSRNPEAPTKYREHSNKKVWWICSKCGYNWQAQINERSNGTGCPCCAGKIAVSGINDFASIRPDLVCEWNTDKNGDLKPDSITAYTHRKAWWVCSKCNHEWCASVANRSKGRGCPKCAKRIVYDRKR